MPKRPTRREILRGAAAVAVVAAVPAVPVIAAPVAEYVEPELVQGVDYIDWWDECELRSFLRAFAGLKDGRFDAVVDA